jgi:hypothetical protein
VILMCKAQNKKMREKFKSASGKGFIELCAFQDVFKYVNHGVMRDEIQRAAHARMKQENLVAHFFTNTDYNLWE